MTPPLSPNPASSLPRQEKRWTVEIDGEDKNYANLCTGTTVICRCPTWQAKALAKFHNATLSEPKESEEEEKKLMADIYEWLNGPMTRKPLGREEFHCRLGKLLGKPSIEYHE